MTMKKAELDKQLGLKISNQGKGPSAGRFGSAGGTGVDRREQRRADAAAGLVPFACKLPSTLAARLGELAVGYEGGLNALVADLLGKSLPAKADAGAAKS